MSDICIFSSSHPTPSSTAWQVLYTYNTGPTEIKPLKGYLGIVLLKYIWNREYRTEIQEQNSLWKQMVQEY